MANGHKLQVQLLTNKTMSNTAKSKSLKKLYSVSSVIEKFHHRGRIFKNVKFLWFASHREKPLIGYERSIKNYDDSDESIELAEGKIRELFSFDEVKQLQDYLVRKLGHIAVEFIEFRLPLEVQKAYPFGAFCSGRFEGFITLKAKEKNYPFDFCISAYFDVEDDAIELNASETQLRFFPKDQGESGNNDFIGSVEIPVSFIQGDGKNITLHNHKTLGDSYWLPDEDWKAMTDHISHYIVQELSKASSINDK